MLSYAVLLMAGQAAAHMIMKTPAPYGNPDNSPLSSSGANFPCKLTGDPATFYSGVDATEMAVGTDQTLSFTGSAVHGGGSCQLAITSDTAPTASSQWQVILSIEGGCPSTDGTAASDYTFQIPDSVPAGDYTFAWTWISKLAGQPEYYMNCAPIKVTGGASKRSDLAIAARSDLPGLFVANMGDLNDCKTVPGTDPVFPNPGSNVSKPGATPNYADVTGNCIAPGTSEGGSGGGGGGNDTPATTEPPAEAPATTPAAEEPASTPAAEEPASTPASTPASAPAATQTPASGGPLPGATFPSGFITSSKAAGGGSTPSKTSSAASAPSASAAPSSGTVKGAQTGACTDEGVFNCPDGSTYQQCASGMWTSIQSMPGGTKCAVGTSTSLWARGEIRGGRVHRRIPIVV